MNPLTLVKRIQNINSKEAALGISEEASWHAKYKGSAYVFVGGIPFDLTEGDLLAVFAQYGEIVDVNLVRDKGTGKSKGFAFVAYEDQRSTILAVDNLNGAQILGRTIRVDHVTKYKKKEEEDEETEKRKREERGVCRAFQRGDCTRGAGCKFSHDEQRAAKPVWGAPEDAPPKWGHDKFKGPKKGNDKDIGARAGGNGRALAGQPKEDDSRGERRVKGGEYDMKSRDDSGRREAKNLGSRDDIDSEPKPKEYHERREDNNLRRQDDSDFEPKSREDHDKRDGKRWRRNDDNESPPKLRRDYDRREEKRSRVYDEEEHQPKLREDYDRREGERSRRHRSESYNEEKQDKRRESWSTQDRDSSSHPRRER